EPFSGVDPIAVIEVQKILEGIEGIRFMYFTNRDVVRHKLVQQIIKAYEQYEGQNGQQE
ncbi:MAG: PhoH family protein, partial [Nitrospirota bacterium]